jgi:SAM-dependent methyltransferase
MWVAGDAYEAYVGRWSRRVAEEFVRWVGVPAGWDWLDVGCGTGALTEAVLAVAEPSRVVGVDPAEGFLADARTRLPDPRASFHHGDARSLPMPDGSFDAVVSGLAINFVPDAQAAVDEFARLCAPKGVVAAYVWDYADGMAMMRYFWNAAIAADPSAVDLDEATRFPMCRPGPLRHLWTQAGLKDVAVQPIDVDTVFANFEDFWQPFLGGQGPAPAYAMSLSESHREAIRDWLTTHLPIDADGSISLTARAWAVRGTASQS